MKTGRKTARVAASDAIAVAVIGGAIVIATTIAAISALLAAF